MNGAWYNIEGALTYALGEAFSRAACMHLPHPVCRVSDMQNQTNAPSWRRTRRQKLAGC